MRSLLGSRWVRRLTASLAIGVALALLAAAFGLRWGAWRTWARAEEAWERGEYRRAAELFQKMADAYPDEERAAEALFRVGRINYLFLGEVPEAVHVLRSLARREDGGTWALRSQLLLGEIFEVRQGDCRQAIVEYQRFIGMNRGGEGNDEAQLAVARCSFAIGEYEQARAEYENLLERYPDSPLRQRALAGAAGAHSVTGRPGLAIRAYREVLAAGPDPVLAAEARFGIASALEESGDLAGALAELEAARDGYPNPGLVEERIERVRQRIAKQGPRGKTHDGGE